MDASDWIALGAAVISVIALTVSGIFSWITVRHERLSHRLQYASLKEQYFAGLRMWSEKLADLLSEAVHLCDLDPARLQAGEFFGRRHSLRIALSSLIDQGRWYFPNLDTETYGIHKHRAFQGYRQQVLNSLVDAYKLIGSLDYALKVKNEPLRNQLVDAKKRFASEIQFVLDPAKRDSEFRQITQSAVDDTTALAPSA